jgi:multidrug efflux pump subunit AcrA (membrane-fusion protein)
MYKLLSLTLVISLLLSSCWKTIEIIPEKKYKTFVVQDGALAINDTIIASIEWWITSQLAFKAWWRISEIYVQPWQEIKSWQILARLENKESAIQVQSLSKIEKELIDLGLSTNDIKLWTQSMGNSLAKLYDKRISGMDINILSLKNTLEKAKQNLGNETSTLSKTFATLAHDFDRVTSSMLYEWDKILGLTTNFDYTNDSWEDYLWTRTGNLKVDADNKWGNLYWSRGKIRSYIDSGATIPDINRAVTDLKEAYNNARLFATSMNHMFQNSVVGWWLPEEKLNAWVTMWNGFSSDEQQSEARFIAWNNQILSLTSSAGGSGSVADKDITSLELELKNLEISRETLLAEKESKLKEIKANVDTIRSKYWEVSVQIEQTRMNSSLARESLEYNIIRAPFDGIVLEKYGDIGNIVGAGIPVVKLSSNDRFMIKTYLDNDMYKYKLNDSIVLENISTNQSLSGTITLIQNEKDPIHNKNYIEIKILSTDQSIGERVVLKLTRTKTPFQNGVIIPLESIVTRYGPPWVFLVKDGKAVFTLVTLVWSDLKLVEVIGIPEWSVLITEGKENMIDGELLVSQIKDKQ